MDEEDDEDEGSETELGSLEDCVANDLEAAQKVCKLFPHIKYCREQLYVFNRETGMYDTSDSTLTALLISLADRLHKIKFVKGLPVRSERSYGNTCDQMSKLTKIIKSISRDDNWLNAMTPTSLGKLLFKNGYYDMAAGRFYDEFDPTIMFMGKIHDDFEDFTEEDLEYQSDIEERCFAQLLGGAENAHYVLTTFSRALAGDQQKRVIIGLGDTDTGKSMFTLILKSSLGDYCGEFNAGNLAYRSTSQDEAQQLRWAYLLRGCRLIISNEVKMNDGAELDSNMVKKLSNGGNESLVGRVHHGLETAFEPHFLMAIFGNAFPQIKPYDDAVSNRLKVVEFKTQYVENPTRPFQLKKMKI